MYTQSDTGNPSAADRLRPFRLTPSDQQKLGKSLKPGFLLPEQLYDSPLRAHRTRGEVALMYVVLDAAISDFHLQFVKHGQRPQRLAREAEEWMRQNDTEWPFSFVNICAVLGIEPDYIRRGLKQWKEHPSTTPPSRRQRSVPRSVPLETVA